jgi:hypothetical protein
VRGKARDKVRVLRVGLDGAERLESGRGANVVQRDGEDFGADFRPVLTARNSVSSILPNALDAVQD